jgi:hypothetical protein
MWRVCAIALSFVSGWRAFSSVSLCKSIYLSIDGLLCAPCVGLALFCGFALRSFVLWCVCAFAPGFISDRQAFSSVSLCVKSICPPFRFFPTLSSPPAIPSAGPALASSSRGCASGLLVLVPDAPALAPAAALALPDDPAPSPGRGTPFRSLDPLGVPPPLGPRAGGDGMFVFPRRLVVGDVSVIHLAAASFPGGATRTPGFAAAARDASKRRTHRKVSSALPFVPM